MGTSVESSAETSASDGLAEAVSQLQAATDAKKCWACGCLRHALDALERAVPEGSRPVSLADAMVSARAHQVPQRYECLGCEICYPAVALNALGAAGGCATDEAVCPTEPVETRSGWPPLPGSYRVLRYQAPVAVCTLNSEDLIDHVAAADTDAISIAGGLQTENLGIERLVTNVLANPFIRFVIVCGADSQKMIGHLPGQSLVALARDGLNANRQIINAKGKRPVLRNLEPAAVDHFRRTVEVVDLIGVSNIESIIAAAHACGERNPGPAEPFAPNNVPHSVAGTVPVKMVSDPAGYFVIFIDRVRGLLNTEHYYNTGVLTTIIEGHSAAEVYMTVIERGLLTRLDHAAYLGRELARAEQAMLSGGPYVQDAAPEQCSPDCSCHHS